MTTLSKESMEALLFMQQNERTESEIYKMLARHTKDEENKKTLLRLAEEELIHYRIWETYTHREMKPQKWKVRKFSLMARIFGFTFAVKLMEKGESGAQINYEALISQVPEAESVLQQENQHENDLIDMLDEERLRYVGSMVLGLNDALVELTGTLAGMTLALQNTRLIALSGLITGISATLSMASSEFLSAKSEGRTDALKSCTYTGIAYVITVALLILPYLLLPDDGYLIALGIMLVVVVLIILGFNYYISVAKGLNFKKRFLEMAAISLGVAVLSFGIGLLVKNVLGIDL